MEAARTLQTGQLPDNSHLTSVIDKANQALLSNSGNTMAQKTAAVLESTKAFLNEKNQNSELQNLYQHGLEAGSATSGAARGVASGMQGTGTHLRSNLPSRTFLKELATSSEFRSLLMQAIQWVRTNFIQRSEGQSSTSMQQQIWDQYRQFVRVLASKPEYYQAINGFYDVLYELRTNMRSQLPEAQSSLRDPAKAAAIDARAFLENLAGGYSLEPVINDLRAIADYMKTDARLSMYLREARDFLESCIRNPTLMEQDATFSRAQGLYQQGMSFGREYKESTFMRDLFTQVQSFMQAIRNDPTNQRLAADLRSLAAEFITTAPDGTQRLNTDAISQIRQMLVPLIVEQLDVVPIPRIEGHNESMQWSFDNLVFHGYDVLPDHIGFKYDNDMDFNFRDLSVNKARQHLLIRIRNMNLHMRDVHFWFKRTATPKIEDEGRADVHLRGKGLNLDIRVWVNPTAPFFQVYDVDCRINRLKIKILEARHEFLLNTVTTVLSPIIRRRVEHAVEDKLRQMLVKVEAVMNRGAEQVRVGAHKVADAQFGIPKLIQGAQHIRSSGQEAVTQTKTEQSTISGHVQGSATFQPSNPSY